MTPSPLWTQLDAAIDAHASTLIKLRRHLHAHPEPSGEEFQTSLAIQQCLNDAGYQTRLGLEGRGVIADSSGVADNSALPPRIALRADIDALRIHEANAVEYCSQRPGLMHACGHDGHTATVMGAMLGLQAVAATGALPWPVSWRGVFQPAEETGTGALDMIAAGAIEDCAAILSIHMDPSRAVGRIGLRPGALTASCDDVVLTINGRGGHAARPHESLDPIATAAQLISSLYLFIPRGIDSHDPVVLTIGQIIAGDSANVIPEQAVLRGTLRTLGGPVRERTKQHVQQLARGLAEASGTQVKVEFTVGPPSVHNDAALVALLQGVGADVLGADAVEAIPRPSMGGEDFAFYGAHIPSAMFRLGCASPAVGHASLHSANFDLDERALLIGAKILARAVIKQANPQNLF